MSYLLREGGLCCIKKRLIPCQILTTGKNLIRSYKQTKVDVLYVKQVGYIQGALRIRWMKETHENLENVQIVVN